MVIIIDAVRWACEDLIRSSFLLRYAFGIFLSIKLRNQGHEITGSSLDYELALSHHLDG